MQSPRFAFLTAAALLMAACSPQNETDAPLIVADLVLSNGHVLTAEGWTEAVAVADGRILATGASEALAVYADDAAEVIDLQGKVVLPGFHDLHVHPLYGGMMYSGANPRDCFIKQGSNLDAITAAVAACVEKVGTGSWVTGGQWDVSAIGQLPTRHMLDPVSAETPVLLNDTSGHSAWANSMALAMAGIDVETPDPEGGIIERDGDGAPTGLLRESAIELVRMHVPPPTDQVIRPALAWALQEMASYGITSFTEASSGFVTGSSPREAALYAALADDGLLKQRTRLCITWAPGVEQAETLIAERKQYERELLTLDCVKIFLDGVPTDSHTAAMLEPYEGTIAGRDDEASRRGLLLVAPEVLNQAVARFDKQGLRVKFHAAGDAAVRAGLDAIAYARQQNGMGGPRHDVGHCTHVAPEDMPRGTAINAAFEISPYLFSPSPIINDLIAAVGQERADRAWPARSLLDAGALVVAGSDWSVVPSVNPWVAMETLVTREAPGGSQDSFAKAEAISVAEALDLFTKNAATHSEAADQLGQITPGLFADLVVVDRNPLTSPVNELHTTKVLMTFLNGEKTFDAGQG